MQRWPFPSNRRVLYRKQDSSKDNRFQTNGENPRRKIEFVQATSTHCPICLKLVVSHSSSSYMEKRSLTKRDYRSEPTEQSLSSSHSLRTSISVSSLHRQPNGDHVHTKKDNEASLGVHSPIFVLIDPVQSLDLASSANGSYGLRPQ